MAPLATENMPENTDVVTRPHISVFSRAAACYLLFMRTRAKLMPALFVSQASANLAIRWDQHVEGMAMNAPYKRSAGAATYASYSYSFYKMGLVTQQWQAEQLNKTILEVPGVRTVVFEENGSPGWKNGTNIHSLARGIGHAQNILAFQRVVAPDNQTGQVLFCGQADCMQAWKQNHQPDCIPSTDRDHCNNWDQGGVFFDNTGKVWGQPNFWAGRMLSESHQPNVVHVGIQYNSSFPPPPPSPPKTADEPIPPEYDVPVALDAHASISAANDRLSVRVVNPTPLPIQARVDFGGRVASSAAAAAVNATILTSGSLRDDNPLDNQQNVYPKAFPVDLQEGGERTDPIWFPAYSFVSMQFVLAGPAAVEETVATPSSFAPDSAGQAGDDTLGPFSTRTSEGLDQEHPTLELIATAPVSMKFRSL